jgi:SAM-dependent methyltransferase
LNEGWLGGTRGSFIKGGREQLVVLLEHGLDFQSVVLDVGCGCLRGSRWVIPLLDRGHFFGIEPQRAMVERGLREFVDPEIVRLKEPRFDHNDRFDFSVFDTTFTHFMMRSIWSHASKQQIEVMLDNVVEWGQPGAVLLTSYHPAREGWADYRGADWQGRSHVSERPAAVAHAFEWIQAACETRGLDVRAVDRPPLAEDDQVWLAVKKPGELPVQLPPRKDAPASRE